MQYYTIALAYFLLLTPFLSAQNITGFSSENADAQRQLESQIRNLIDPDAFKSHLYALSSEPHIAGTPESQRVIQYIGDAMQSAGLEVNFYDYDVLLAEPGMVEITLELDEPLLLQNREKEYKQDPWSSHPALTHGWNAYSGSGKVKSEVIYVNYGRLEDFQKIDSLGINLEGKIVLARYGGNFRGFKAKYAEEAGAIGLIIFTDPANSGFKLGDIYPDGPFNDASAIQRGSLLTLDYYGDPLTPFEVALPLDHPDSPVRKKIEEVALPKIPVAPIGYGAAYEILSRMEGQNVPEDWQGGFDFQYSVQGGPDLLVTLEVQQEREIKRITNITGTIKGRDFPDEWVIIGCHHDAWTFGAADPNSGTAMMLSLSDVLGELLEGGWQPKRSIVFAHWDAEEFGLIGSVEWVEHHLEELMAKTVVYLNSDMSVTGPNFRASGTPSLHSAIMEAATAVIHPDTQLNLLEYWLRGSQSEEPSFGRLGSGSDFVPFVHRAGIPSAQISMSGRVPVYHSAFDNLFFYEQFIDSHFVYGATLAEYYGVLATRFANADIIPYDPLRTASVLEQKIEEVTEIAGKDIFEATNLPELVDLLGEQAGFYNSLLNIFPKNDGLRDENLQQLNSILIGKERQFIMEEGLEFRPWLRNVFLSPDPLQGYAAWALPAYRYAIEMNLLDDLYHMHKTHQTHTQILMDLIISLSELNELMR